MCRGPGGGGKPEKRKEGPGLSQAYRKMRNKYQHFMLGTEVATLCTVMTSWARYPAARLLRHRD